jgi:hypothetical protein
MRSSQIALLASVLLIVVTSAQARMLHGSRPAFEGKTWKEALEKVQCQYVTKVGNDLTIAGLVIVDGMSFPNPTITKDDLIEPLEKRCFPKP